MAAYRLVVEKGSSKGKHVRLKANGSVVVGRDMSNALQISDPQTSRKHFQIEAKLGEYVLKDLSSSNGTFVNGEKLTTPTRKLAAGDKIAIGDTLVYFLAETSEDGATRKGDLTGREIAGYRIGRLLGRGGMGTVYEAVQISLERKVAFKVLSPELSGDPEFIERFISEARAAGRLNHANIVSVFDVGQQEDLYFYSMEYMAGGSVDDLIRREKTLAVARTIPIMFDAARGLEYAEKQGLTHRDIKPDNLMLGTDEVVKISDLGLAIFTSRQHDVSGSPHYIAPEQALGKDIDHRADLYALGVTWYQLLSGKTPFEGSSAQEIARKHVEEQAPPLREIAPQVPEDVAGVVERLMLKDPDERLGSARQLQADLAELARRYPVRETILLRIDAVAPDDPPSELLLAYDENPLAGSRASLLLLAALAILLLVGAFAITSSLMSNNSRERDQAQARVAKAQLLLDEGKLEEAAAEATDLATELEDQGFSDLAEEATKIRDQAAAARKTADEAELAKTAAARLKTARDLLAQHATTGVNDAATRSRLEEVRRMLNRIIEDYPTTPAAKDAQEVRNEVSKQLRTAQEARRKHERRLAAATKALQRTQQRIKDLLRERSRSRFENAAKAAREFVERYGQLRPREGQLLLRDVKAQTRSEVRSRTARALTLVSQKKWDEAKFELAKVRPPLGFPDLDRTVRDAEKVLLESKSSAARAQELEKERAAWRLYDKAIRSIQSHLDRRDFARAASNLRSEKLLLRGRYAKTPRQLADTRISRLTRAGQALDRLAAHVKAKKPGVTLELVFTGAGRAKAIAIRYDTLTRTFTFRHPRRRKFLRDVRLVDVGADELLKFFAALDQTPAQKLELACLAFELRQKRTAAGLLDEVRGLAPNLGKTIEDLELLDGHRR